MKAVSGGPTAATSASGGARTAIFMRTCSVAAAGALLVNKPLLWTFSTNFRGL